MTYGQVIMILFVGLVLYYAFLIFTDIQKARAAETAEQENHMEEDIDISEEARSFQPKKVNREEPKKEEENKESSDNGEQQENSNNEGKEEPNEPTDESEEPASENNQDTETTESEEEQDDTESETSDKDKTETTSKEFTEEQSSRTTYREAIMTDGILVDDIFKVIDRLAETGECDLGTIIYSCENMRFAG